LGGEGFRVACIPSRGGSEWEFLLERPAGARERYGYQFTRLDDEELFQAVMTSAERDGFRLTDVLDRRYGLFERVIK
jgi:hypothetical protein